MLLGDFQQEILVPSAETIIFEVLYRRARLLTMETFLNAIAAGFLKARNVTLSVLHPFVGPRAPESGKEGSRDAGELPPPCSSGAPAPVALHPDRSMPPLALVDVDDDNNPAFVGPGVPVAVSRPAPTSEAEEDAPSGHDEAVSDAAPPCRVEEEHLAGTCQDDWHTVQLRQTFCFPHKIRYRVVTQRGVNTPFSCTPLSSEGTPVTLDANADNRAYKWVTCCDAKRFVSVRSQVSTCHGLRHQTRRRT